MKYDYKFATGTETVELDEKWVKVLKDLDKKEDAQRKLNERHTVFLETANDYSTWGVDFQEFFEDVEPSFREKMIEKLPMAMEQLRPAQRELIDSVYFQKMSQQELADEFGVTQGAISQRLATAIKNLKKFLEKS